MKLVNDTWLDCHLSRLQLFYKDLLQAVVVVKGSFQVQGAAGEARPSADASPVLVEDTETPYGPIETEVVPAKAWCDLAVLGHAYSPNPRRAVTSQLVSLKVGALRRRVRVTGDRTWERSLGGFRPSAPRRFTKLPLRYEYAFGGSARQAGNLRLPHADNPDGRGYVLLKEDVEGTPLPNIEETDRPIRAWTDQPPPAGLAPLSRRSMLRAQRGIDADLTRMTSRIGSAAFCFSHPRMSLPAYPAGAKLTLEGASVKPRWRLRLPEFRYEITVELGARHYRLPLTPDTIYLMPDEDKVTVVARRTFIYQFLPQRTRTVRVTAQPVGAALATPAAPTTTIQELRAAPRDDVPILIEPSRAVALPLEAMVEAYPMIDLVRGFPICPSG